MVHDLLGKNYICIMVDSDMDTDNKHFILRLRGRNPLRRIDDYYHILVMGLIR